MRARALRCASSFAPVARRALQKLHDLAQACLGLCRRLVAEPRDDDVCLARDMVIGDPLPGYDEVRVRQAAVVGRLRSEPLQSTCRVVPEVADDATVEGRQTLLPRG